MPMLITGISLQVDQVPFGVATHDIQTSAGDCVISDYYTGNELIYPACSFPTTTSFVQLTTTESPSWIAWGNIHITCDPSMCDLFQLTGTCFRDYHGGCFVDCSTPGCPPAGCQSICDDPHFVGLDGNRYDFMGTANTTFALLSDDEIELNSRFVQGQTNLTSNSTYLGQTCLRVCNETVIFHPNKTVIANGKQVEHVLSQPVSFGGHFQVVSLNSHTVKVTVSDRWVLEVAMMGDRVNINHVTPINDIRHSKVHGVLGHTLYGPDSGPGCNSAKQGACEVAGKYEDYEVHGDLCSPDWMHSQFKRKHCDM